MFYSDSGEKDQLHLLSEASSATFGPEPRATQIMSEVKRHDARKLRGLECLETTEARVLTVLLSLSEARDMANLITGRPCPSRAVCHKLLSLRHNRQAVGTTITVGKFALLSLAATPRV